MSLNLEFYSTRRNFSILENDIKRDIKDDYRTLSGKIRKYRIILEEIEELDENHPVYQQVRASEFINKKSLDYFTPNYVTFDLYSLFKNKEFDISNKSFFFIQRETNISPILDTIREILCDSELQVSKIGTDIIGDLNYRKYSGKMGICLIEDPNIYSMIKLSLPTGYKVSELFKIEI